jgi:hypothetical protein
VPSNWVAGNHWDHTVLPAAVTMVKCTLAVSTFVPTSCSWNLSGRCRLEKGRLACTYRPAAGAAAGRVLDEVGELGAEGLPAAVRRTRPRVRMCMSREKEEDRQIYESNAVA